MLTQSLTHCPVFGDHRQKAELLREQRYANEKRCFLIKFIPYISPLHILPLHSPLRFQLYQKVAEELSYSVAQTLQGKIQNH